MEPDYDAYDAVELFWVQGVVKNGQVVLDPPLDLPDGTVVTVMKYDPDDNPLPREPTLHLTPEQHREFERLLHGRATVEEWAAFEERIGRKRGAA